MYAAAQAGKLPVYHRKIRGDHGAGEETGEGKGLKYLFERGSGGSRESCGFYRFDISGKYDSVHSGFFRRFDIFRFIVQKETILWIEIPFIKEKPVNFRLRFCEQDRCGEKDPVKFL